MPLLHRMEVAFWLEDRNQRGKTLQELRPRADVTLSENYRRIIEAYQIELEYGRTLDTYEGHIGSGADTRTVSFVRLGRVALM